MVFHKIIKWVILTFELSQNIFLTEIEYYLCKLFYILIVCIIYAAQRKAEMWLTSVVQDGLVESAMVLAASLRETKTTRTVAAVTSRSVSAKKR